MFDHLTSLMCCRSRSLKVHINLWFLWMLAYRQSIFFLKPWLIAIFSLLKSLD